MSELKPANCCICGRIVDTREQVDGGDAFGCELADGRWTCSPDCYDTATGERRPSPSISEGEVEAAQEAYALAMGQLNMHPEAPIASMPHPMRAALEAASKARATTDVEVKALEWRELTDDRGDGTREPNGDWEAETPLGIYSIEMIPVGDTLTVWGLTYGIGIDYIGGDHYSPNEAKAAAQLDYATRIRSALVGGE